MRRREEGAKAEGKVRKRRKNLSSLLEEKKLERKERMKKAYSDLLFNGSDQNDAIEEDLEQLRRERGGRVEEED